MMSALPPKADIRGAKTNVRQGPIADIALLIRSPRQREKSCLRRGDTERFGGSLIDYDFYRSGLLNWQISWPFAFENPAGVMDDDAKRLDEASSVAKETTRGGGRGYQRTNDTVRKATVRRQTLGTL